MSPPERQKVAIITGASQGIGAGLVAGFRVSGYAVVGTSRSIPSSEEPDYDVQSSASARARCPLPAPSERRMCRASRRGRSNRPRSDFLAIFWRPRAPDLA
jgi:NAD(P)-dependent dehydrogenase (short-subunit alcohol dehydrogenase family)